MRQLWCGDDDILCGGDASSGARKERAVRLCANDMITKCVERKEVFVGEKGGWQAVTCEKIGKETSVTGRTIKNDAQLALAVEGWGKVEVQEKGKCSSGKNCHLF